MGSIEELKAKGGCFSSLKSFLFWLSLVLYAGAFVLAYVAHFAASFYLTFYLDAGA